MGKLKMADFLTKTQRSQRMAAIKGKANEKTELRLKSLFNRYGITGWRRHYPITGRPDFVFLKLKIAIFVDGCFWHSCPKHSHIPRSNTTFWKQKFLRNRTRDRRVTVELRRSGWKVLRIWEHELARKNEALVLQRIIRLINKIE